MIKIERKSRGRVRSARKEITEQMRIRNAFERKLVRQMINFYADVFVEAAEEYGKNPVINVKLSNLNNKLSDVLLPHYNAVIGTMSDRFVVISKKEEEGWIRYYREYVNGQGAVSISNISSSTVNRVRRVIEQAQDDELTLPQVQKRLRDLSAAKFNRPRAAVIARTETHSAASFANHKQAEELGVPLRKRWVSTNDARTRSHHSAANSQEVGMDEDFLVGGVPMGYAGDPRGGAKNTINCRCVVLYIEPDDVVVDETTPVEPLPVQEPVQQGRGDRNRSSPIDPINLGTLKILSKSQVQKQLNEQLSEAAQDDRYINKKTTHYSGAKLEFFGKSVFAKDLTDESATLILALKKEIDEICDRAELPRIRSIVVRSSKKHNMAMGDGVLYINPNYVNPLANKLKLRDLDSANVEGERIKLSKQIDDLRAEHTANKDAMAGIYAEIEDLRSRRKEYSLNEYIPLYNQLVDDYKKVGSKNKRIFNKLEKLDNQRNSLSNSVELEASTWDPSQPLKDRPFSAKFYYSDPLERVRHTMYHEIGHQIHQTYKFKAKQSYLDSSFGKLGYEPEFTQVDRPLDKWLDSRSTESLLYGGGREGKIVDPEKAKLTWSTYGNYNGHEWFAENNANYWKGDRERVDPKFSKLMEAILRGDDIDDKSLY